MIREEETETALQKQKSKNRELKRIPNKESEIVSGIRNAETIQQGL